MKIRYGFVTNSSSTSFLILYHGEDKKHRLYKALGVIPNLGSVPIEYRGYEQILAYIDKELAEEERYHKEELEREEKDTEKTAKEQKQWIDMLNRWHRDRVTGLEKLRRMIEKHQQGGAIAWVTEPIEDQGGTYFLFRQLEEYGTKDGITVLRFEEHR